MVKQVLNKKIYDTERAKRIAHGLEYNEVFPSFSPFFFEVLYLKEDGEYFLFGKGNYLSKYSETEGAMNEYEEWKGFIPLNKEEVQDWVKQHGDKELYEKFFGEVKE